MSKNILLDTGFWFAVYTPGDQYHKDASAIIDLLTEHNILIPWPTLYETLNTAFLKRRDVINSLEILIKQANVKLIDDTEYNASALEETVSSARKNIYLSLVDSVIRQIILDVSIKVDYLVTFNEKDFIDVCVYRNIEIYK